MSDKDEFETAEFLERRAAEAEAQRAEKPKTTRARNPELPFLLKRERSTRKERLLMDEKTDLHRRAVRAAERTMWAAVFACVISVVALVVSLMVYIKPPAP